LDQVDKILTRSIHDRYLGRIDVDVDRVQVSYETLGNLVADLRRMGATSILNQRPRKPLLREAKAAAEAAFRSAGDGSRTLETFEILHFAAWTPAA
jgi:hypothetical protein